MRLQELPKLVCIAFFLIFSSEAILFAQSEENDILTLIANADFERAKRKVEALSRRQPGSAKALYFTALIEKDAEKAIKLYNDILLLHKQSEYAPKAHFKIALYYFTKGFYFSARKIFSDVVKNHPRSQIVHEASYYAAKCLLVTGKPDSARIELKNIIANNVSAAVRELATEDLKFLEPRIKETHQEVTSPVPPQPSNHSKAKKNHTIQIGAYSRYENAASQKKYFKRQGYAVEIVRTRANRRYLYKVYVGRYASQDEAERYARAFQSKYGLSFRIVNLEK